MESVLSSLKMDRAIDWVTLTQKLVYHAVLIKEVINNLQPNTKCIRVSLNFRDHFVSLRKETTKEFK
jgi:hypothetical protein